MCNFLSIGDDVLSIVMVTLFDALVLAASILSIILCTRSIYNAVGLMKVKENYLSLKVFKTD